MRRRRSPSGPLKVTPSMRRKVETLARWVAAGDPRKARETTRAVMDLYARLHPKSR